MDKQKQLSIFLPILQVCRDLGAYVPYTVDLISKYAMVSHGNSRMVG